MSLRKKLLWIAGLMPVLFSVWIHLITWTPIIHFTPRMNLQFIDQKTLRPIPGVLVRGEWSKKSALNFHSTPRIKKVSLISDEKGIVQIPAFLSIHIWSYFEDEIVSAIHPFYQPFGSIAIERSKLTLFDKEKDVSGDLGLAQIRLLSLEDKYAGIECVIRETKEGNRDTCRGTSHDLYVDLFNNKEYFSINDFQKNKNVVSKASALSLWDSIYSDVYGKSHSWKKVEMLFK